MKTTHKGRTTTVSEFLFEPPITIKNPPRKSYKFDVLCLYYDGVYYFVNDIKPSTEREGKPFEIQGVFYTHKWYQDTFYITRELKSLLENSI